MDAPSNLALQLVGHTASRTGSEDLRFEQLLWKVYQRLKGRPPFSYDVARKILWAVLSGGLPLAAALTTCARIRNDLSRKHNTEVVKCSYDLLKGTEALCMKFGAQFLPFSAELPNLSIKIPTDRFFVLEGRTVFPLFQFSKVDAPTVHQLGYMVGLAHLALVRAGFDKPEVWIVNLSQIVKGGPRVPRIYHSEHLVIPNEHELNVYLTLLAEVYLFLSAHTEEEIRVRAGRPPRP